MKSTHLHIISFNIPFPANYGGVIDVFYKIKALSAAGVSIHLHCFEYGRTPADELKKYCSEISYYHRSTGFLKNLSFLPYIVNSRNAKTLLENLKKDDAPILFEGLHTCYFLNHQDLKNRKRYVRMHNVEWEYYDHLAKMESHFIKKIYFKMESWRLKSFERNLKNANGLLAISRDDEKYLKQKYPNVPVCFSPAFHPNEKVEIQPGRGDYALFHGDLSVKDNERAAIWLVKNVFAYSPDIQLIVAGLNPSGKLKTVIFEYSNVILKANVPENEMQQLLKNAHVNILLSFQSAGMKLKLLNALFRGRFCVVNSFMVKNTGLENLCDVENEPEDFQQILNTIFQQDFPESEISRRKKLLEGDFSNQKNGAELARIFFP